MNLWVIQDLSMLIVVQIFGARPCYLKFGRGIFVVLTRYGLWNKLLVCTVWHGLGSV
jgi:hypothetical protein